MIDICVCLIILCTTGCSNAFSLSSVKNSIKCKFEVGECCEDWWTKLRSPLFFSGLVSALNSKVYGQHLALDTVTRHIKGRSQGDPSKALAFSFHGGTGTGKNYVSRVIIETLRPNGMESEFVHLIVATKEFVHEQETEVYRDKIRELVETKVKDCPYSIFIFDEIEKAPHGVLDILKSYLDFHVSLGGVDFRKATFFFLSNTGAQAIATKTLEHWKRDSDRTHIRLRDMEEVLRLDVINREGGFWHSDLIVHGLITAYVPFLPLERTHVKQCIRDGLTRKAYYKTEHEIPEDLVQEIADELAYFPDDLNVFSTLGCKRVLDKIDLVMSS